MFINGLNLGRYWSIGPQQALYLPGPFLNSGINQVQIVDDLEMLSVIVSIKAEKYTLIGM